MGRTVAIGYLKVLSYDRMEEVDTSQEIYYELTLTDYEVKRMFLGMVRDWFSEAGPDYNDFIKELLQDDIDAMNAYINSAAFKTFSYFDTGNSYREEPERIRSYGFAFEGKQVLIG